MFEVVSAFLPIGEPAKNLMARMMIWKIPQTRQNCVTTE